MASPAHERPEPTYGDQFQPMHSNRPAQPRRSHDSEGRVSLPSYNVNHHRNSQHEHEKSSDEDGTVVGEAERGYEARGADGRNERENVLPHTGRPRGNSHLTVKSEYEQGDPLRSMTSHTREQAYRLDDDLEMLKIERQVSKANEAAAKEAKGLHGKNRRREAEPEDEFDVATNPVHEKTQVYKPVEAPSSGFGKFVKGVHQSNWLIRYFTYIIPVSLIILIPLLVGVLEFPNASVGGVRMYWFCIWLEIVWNTLWAGRILAKCLPWPIGVLSSLFTNNGKKWRDMGKQLELPATLFFWWLAIEISFLPTMSNHNIPVGDPTGGDSNNHGKEYTAGWMNSMNKVLVAILVGVVLNFAEKIIIQLIAISFHLRTYADRIELNKFQIGSLAKLYKYSKEKIAMEDSEFDIPSAGDGSGARTPGAFVNEAGKATKEAFSKFGDIAGKVAGDFTGKQAMNSSHPNQVVLQLISSTSGAQVLARRLYRTFGREDTETIVSDDLRNAFENDEEADAAFSMFDKDMNGDISMEELEAVCVEIGRERKSITASLKDLDSVVGRLDDVFMFLVFVIAILVLISLISTSAAGVLTSAGSVVLALSWLFSATAQEFLQSVIFVFVKHPFDVGDRVGVYGNTGSTGMGDDYFVKKISLLYTEFKKMEGQIVQAPNSYLNGLFILNQRRSGGQAEAVPVTLKFGTTLDQIDGLRQKLLDFVIAEKREYQGKILTELREIVDVHYMTLNVVFFYKTNWQNEGLRLARRNKFICALMVCIQEMGIEGPYMRFPGMKQSFPMYLQNVPHVAVPGGGHSGHPDEPTGFNPNDQPAKDPQTGEPPIVSPTGESFASRGGSILKNTRNRGESLSAMNRRVDFSLGAKSMAADDDMGDIHDMRAKPRLPANLRSNSQNSGSGSHGGKSSDIGRTTSRDQPSTGNLARRSTESGSRWGRHHNQPGGTSRHRFFSRQRTNGDEQGLMENGMADIPENTSTGNNSANVTRRGTEAPLDPRSGLVSSRAWTSDNRGDGSAPQISGGLGGQGGAQNPPAPGNVTRSQTEDFEMRRL